MSQSAAAPAGSTTDLPSAVHANTASCPAANTQQAGCPSPALELPQQSEGPVQLSLIKLSCRGLVLLLVGHKHGSQASLEAETNATTGNDELWQVTDTAKAIMSKSST